MKKFLGVLFAVMFCAGLSHAAKYATIGGTFANIRSCGGSKCAVKWKAWKYTPLYMSAVSEDKQWVQVRDFAGHTGWVFNTLLSTQKGLSAVEDVNIRMEPRSGAAIACTVSKGYPLKYISTKGGWLQVEDEPENKADPVCKGWVSAAFTWGPRAKGEAAN